MNARLTRKAGPLPVWGWALVAVAGAYLLRRWRDQRAEYGDGVGPSNGLQPIAGTGGVGPSPLTPESALSATMVSTPAANGVGSTSLAGGSHFTVPKLGFSQVGTGNNGGASTGSGGWETSATYPTPVGYTADQVAAAASRYAQGRSYGGHPYVPLHTQQEGTITTHDGVAGVMVKYDTGGQTTTEWTPLA